MQRRLAAAGSGGSREINLRCSLYGALCFSYGIKSDTGAISNPATITITVTTVKRRRGLW
mgnify:FL=1|jgi:hypothetical protein